MVATGRLMSPLKGPVATQLQLIIDMGDYDPDLPGHASHLLERIEI